MKCFVTGASGFVGANLVGELAARGHQVRALLRPGADERGLAGLDLERVPGDVADPGKLERGMRGCDWCFHVAASYHLWLPDYRPMYQANVEGTRHVLTAAARAGCTRIVYTSTVGCIGLPRLQPDGRILPTDEATPVAETQMRNHYKLSKWRAEQVALELVREGLPIVIVNPSTPVGEQDIKPTPTGRIILDFLLGNFPAYMETGMNLVDVHDVARGHLLAFEKGRRGERYILGGENLTLKQILDTLGEITGLPSPTFKVPHAVAMAFAYFDENFNGRLRHREPRATVEEVRMGKKFMWVDSAKAQRELGYQHHPAHDALERAAQWFVEKGYARPYPALGKPAKSEVH